MKQELHPAVFQQLDQTWGPHTVDRFASMQNTHLQLYNSRFWDPFTTRVDALAQDNWCQHNNFVNAQFRLLPKMLDVIMEQQAMATIIAPWWAAQHWLQRLRAMSINYPIKLPHRRGFIWYGGIRPEPLRNLRWHLYMHGEYLEHTTKGVRLVSSGHPQVPGPSYNFKKHGILLHSGSMMAYSTNVIDFVSQ